MKFRRKALILMAGCFAGSLLAGVGVGYQLFSPHSSRNRASAIRRTLEWGRLEPFPASARDLKIVTEGSMFTRSFRTSFVAPVADVERWLRQSPGTRDDARASTGTGFRRFQIQPGGGANHAELTVVPDNDAEQRVSIYVSWS
ncbi:hypothetical protein TA3x_002088 [Tundrisphaera sp. TA3]|uniref:hypothetical protein n=1 Tax=Tundrisphaera sp. TA3 TaxID=3435775 RepID=UPI003EC0E5A7